jgi:hypothetical protein
MAATLKPGARLFSSVCSTQMIVVKAPSGDVDVTIGGSPAGTAAQEPSGSVEEGHGGGAAIGKRYVDEAGTIELLCTKAGDGVPALNGVVLHLKDAKPLPASD